MFFLFYLKCNLMLFSAFFYLQNFANNYFRTCFFLKQTFCAEIYSRFLHQKFNIFENC